jgi:ADP-ribose pyrophosphatase
MTGPTIRDGASRGGQSHDYRVLARVRHFDGGMFSVYTDEVVMPGGRVAARDYMRHVGAVGVVALDDRGRVVLIQQYRHPLGVAIWELPAGLVDVPGEDLAAAARRELAEEVDLTAARLDLLLDLHTTEMIRIFLARDLAEVPAPGRHARHDEEADLRVVRLDLDEAVSMVLAGTITNAACVAGVLATARARDREWTPLRPADAPQSRPHPPAVRPAGRTG